ncbi:hypothetical protein [Undibacterium sp.]|uniref:hypothetical protein n=1 Tax=Undibacterium sp. TaxID=1914977 RepID=UPI003753333E
MNILRKYRSSILFTVVLLSLILLISFVFFRNVVETDKQFVASETATQRLLDEMTQPLERQQIALDKIVLNMAVIEPYLYAHLNDDRKLGSTNVRYINKPDFFEKYFLTEASFIDEVLVELLCGWTKQCNSTESRRKEIGFNIQKEVLYDWCRSKYEARGIICHSKGRQ